MLERYPEVKVVATAKALAMLGNFFEGMDFASCSIAVSATEIRLSLGVPY